MRVLRRILGLLAALVVVVVGGVYAVTEWQLRPWRATVRRSRAART